MSYYRPSGKISPRVGLWLLVSTGALMPIAWVYAWLMLFAPVGPIILLFAVVFGGCCARAAYLTAGSGLARNPRRMAWIGAGIGLIGWYWQWVAWLSLASTQSSVAAILNHATPTLIDFATSPRLMYALAVQIREAGLIDDNGRSLVKSPGFAWILECVFATALSAVFAFAKTLKPFCESGDNWGEIVELPKKHAFITDREDFVNQMEADPRDTLDTLTSFPSTEQGFSTIEVTICRPSDKAFLTVRNTETSIKDGTKKKKDSVAIQHLSIDVALADDLVRQCATGGNLLPPRADERTPPELRPAIDLLEAGNYDDVLTSVAPYLDSDQEHLCKDAIRLAALASSGLSQWSPALAYWRELFNREASAHNALQVATASVMAGNVAQGEQWMANRRDIEQNDGRSPLDADTDQLHYRSKK